MSGMWFVIIVSLFPLAWFALLSIVSFELAPRVRQFEGLGVVTGILCSLCVVESTGSVFVKESCPLVCV